jgi:ABC-type proline/glycine betaine transport system permease subunit
VDRPLQHDDRDDLLVEVRIHVAIAVLILAVLLGAVLGYVVARQDQATETVPVTNERSYP